MSTEVGKLLRLLGFNIYGYIRRQRQRHHFTVRLLIHYFNYSGNTRRHNVLLKNKN